MSTSGLMTCSFYVKKRSRKNEVIHPLNQSYQAEKRACIYKNVLDMMRAFCQKYSESHDVEDDTELFSIQDVAELDEEDYHALAFTVSSGAHGIESYLVDKNTKKINYERKPSDADMKDFKCLIFIPKDIGKHMITKGIIIFQTIASYGVKTRTVKLLRAFFSNLKLTVEFRNVTVEGLADAYMKSWELNRVTLVKNRISPDKSDNMLISTGREELTLIKPTVKEGWLNSLFTFASSKAADSVFEVYGGKYEDVKMTFKQGRTTRVVSCSNIDMLTTVEILPDALYKNGVTDSEELVKYMVETAIGYKEKMVVSKEGNCDET